MLDKGCMKPLLRNYFIYLLFLLSCSTTKSYRVPELQLELAKNEQQIQYMVESVRSDYERKLGLFEKYENRLKDGGFLSEELKWRLDELSAKRQILVEVGERIRRVNGSLLQGIKGKETVSEREPIFEAIESFGEQAQREAQFLFTAFDDYRSASAGFTKMMLFSRSSLQDSKKNL